jgi:hypothetical protein
MTTIAFADTNADNKMVGSYNSPARIDVSGKWDFNISGSFIYWYAKENGLMVAALEDMHHRPYVLTYADMGFKYKPGFKVAVGMNTGNYDNWVINLEYTWLHASYTGSMSIPEIWYYAMRPNFLSYAIDYYNAPSHGYSFLNSNGIWRNAFDIIDLNLARPFYSGEKLTLSPSFGLRGGILNQYYDGTYVATDLDNTDLRYNLYSYSSQKTWIIGPRVGIVLDWLLGKGVRVTGNTFGSLCYQHFKNYFADFAPSGKCSTNSLTQSQVTPNWQIAAGLGYGTYFANQKWHFDLAATYDFQIFWNQNKMTEMVSDQTTIYAPFFFNATKPADLILHGLTITARFDF